jgi:LytR_cpsA_psr family/LytR cell envelope-related transcriptional attenuator
MSGKHGRHGRRRDRAASATSATTEVATTAPTAAATDDSRRGRARARSHARGHAAPAPSDAGSAAPIAQHARTATIELPPRLPSALLVDDGAADDAEVTSDPAVSSESGPTVSVDLIAPGGGRGSRSAARMEKREERRKRVLLVGAVAVVIALIVWAIAVGSGKPNKHAAAGAAAGRTQATVLVQLRTSNGAVDSALIAHDPASHAGAVVLVPSELIGQVPGFGPMPFGQTLLVDQPSAPQATLSDLMGVTIDGSWVVTTQGLQKLVDAVGGVSVDVDKDVTKPGPNATTTIVVAAGQQKLDGAGAVAFATFLGTDETEQLRLARFDAVFAAVVGQLPKQPAAIAQLLTGLGSTSSTTGIATSRVADVLAGLAADDAAGSTADTVLPVTKLDTGGGDDAFSIDAAGTATLVKQQFADSVPQNKLGTGNRVMIENQVGTPGIGETTRAKLLNAGFTYLPGQNAPGMPNATAPSVVLITGTTAADIAKGDAVATALGLPTSDVRVSQETIQVADIVVLLGADYKA